MHRTAEYGIAAHWKYKAGISGKDKLEDIIASVEDGYYLTNTNNGQADMTGEFMFGVSMGYEIKNGKLGRAILDTTISGVAFDMLKTVDMVSDNMVVVKRQAFAAKNSRCLWEWADLRFAAR